jgi:hypothetical protein
LTAEPLKIHKEKKIKNYNLIVKLFNVSNIILQIYILRDDEQPVDSSVGNRSNEDKIQKFPE